MGDSPLLKEALVNTVYKYLNPIAPRRDDGPNTNIFLDPDEPNWRTYLLNANATPFHPRNIPSSADVPPPIHKDLPMLPPRNNPDRPRVDLDSFVAQITKGEVLEAITIDCSYCLVTHQGPHCYKGGCDYIETVNAPNANSPPPTQEVCRTCFGRHWETHHYNPLNADRIPLFCKYCQTSHRQPICQSGTCLSVKSLPYYCDLDHSQAKCSNRNCFLFAISIEDYKKYHLPKFLCYTCGGRHMEEKETVPTPESMVNCEYCRTRHCFPACLEGTCKRLQKIVTPLNTYDNHPVLYPSTNAVCITCGRRHVKSNYGHNRPSLPSDPSVVRISCLACGHGHPPPACFDGKCGEFNIQNYQNPGSITTKFLCNLCGRRHRMKPQIYSNNPLAVYEECKNCLKIHKKGWCSTSKECHPLFDFSFPKVALTMLECPDCNVRHLPLSSLIRKSIVTETQYPQPGCYNRPSDMHHRQNPIPMTPAHVRFPIPAKPELQKVVPKKEKAKSKKLAPAEQNPQASSQPPDNQEKVAKASKLENPAKPVLPAYRIGAYNLEQLQQRSRRNDRGPYNNPFPLPDRSQTFCRMCNKVHQIPFCRPPSNQPKPIKPCEYHATFNRRCHNCNRAYNRDKLITDWLHKLNLDPDFEIIFNDILKHGLPEVKALANQIIKEKDIITTYCEKLGFSKKDLISFFSFLFISILSRVLF